MRIRPLLFAFSVLVPVAHADAVEDSLEETVVTATRSTQSLQELPQSVSRIDTADIDLVAPVHYSQLLNRVPGVMVQRNSGQESLPSIRSPVFTGNGACGEFLFMENSVPIRPVGFCNVNDMFEVDTEQANHIEVTRGPGTALYGSNAMHGVVNVLQPTPAQMPEFGASFEQGLNTFERAQLSASTVGERTDAGVSLSDLYDGGWRDTSILKQQKFVGDFEHRLDGGGTASLLLSGVNLNQETPTYVTGFDAFQNAALAHGNSDPTAYRHAHAVRLVGDLALPESDDVLINLRPYLRSSRMQFTEHFLIGKPLESDGQDSAGLMTSVDYRWTDRTRLIAGADMEVAHDLLTEYQPTVATDGTPAANAIRPQGLHYDYTVDSLVGAAYAHLEQKLSERLSSTFGLREEWVEYRYTNHMLDGNTRADGTSCGPSGCLYDRPADRNDHFLDLTPKFTLSYDVAPQQMVYLNAARAFRAPTTDELYRLQSQQNIATLKPERADTLETGWRGGLGSLHYALAAYLMRKENVIFRDSQGYNQSNGRTRHRGVEYELNWAPMDELTFAVDGSYSKQTYDFSSKAYQGDTIISGLDIAEAPRHLNNARVEWRPLPGLTSELEWQHVGSYSLDAANRHFYNGYDLLNWRAGWQLSPSWRLSTRVENVTNKVYADRAALSFTTYQYFPGRPRALFVEMAYRKDRDK